MTPYQRLEWLKDIALNKFPAGVYRVAIYIGEQARDGRLVEPMATVAHKIGISYNTVDRALAILVAGGFLTQHVPARQHKGAIFGITNRNDNRFRVTKGGESGTTERPQMFRSESPFGAFSVTKLIFPPKS
jgi:hypothetical protein